MYVSDSYVLYHFTVYVAYLHVRSVRRPPLIEKCTIETNGDAGHRVIIKDMSVAPVTVTLVDNDELRVWCEVVSSPAPR